jgi:DNA-binding NarL/FixJ family response regulator
MEQLVQEIHVGLVDDHKIFRDGIRMALKDKPFLRVLWEAEDGNELKHKLELRMPDIVLLDIRMPNFDGVQSLEFLKKEYPELKIIVLSMFDDQEMVGKMMEVGANGYLTKTSDPSEIYKAIVTCINEDYYFNDLVNQSVLLKLQAKKSTPRKFIPETAKFSEKELNILKLICDDKTTDEISEAVYLSPRTIETIRQNMKAKANVKTIAGLVMYCFRNKLIE